LSHLLQCRKTSDTVTVAVVLVACGCCWSIFLSFVGASLVFQSGTSSLVLCTRLTLLFLERARILVVRAFDGAEEFSFLKRFFDCSFLLLGVFVSGSVNKRKLADAFWFFESGNVEHEGWDVNYVNYGES